MWAADAETNGGCVAIYQPTRVVDVSTAFGSAKAAALSGEAYAEFAAVKALMPHAAAALGFSTLTQDADVVWLADVPSYLKRFHAASMADSPRVDTRTRPCRRKEADLLRAYLTTDKQRADHDASLSRRANLFMMKRLVEGTAASTVSTASSSILQVVARRAGGLGRVLCVYCGFSREPALSGKCFEADVK